MPPAGGYARGPIQWRLRSMTPWPARPAPGRGIVRWSGVAAWLTCAGWAGAAPTAGPPRCSRAGPAAAPCPALPVLGPGHRGWPGVAARLPPAVAAIAAAAALGWRFVPFLAGLAGGAAAGRPLAEARGGPGGRGRGRGRMGGAAGLAGQAGPPVGATARVVAALAGLPPHAAVAIAVTLLVAVLQALAGLWLGWSLVPRPGRPGLG